MAAEDAPVLYDGRQVKLTGMERGILWTIMKAYPRVISHETILLRTHDADSDVYHDTIRVLVCRLRRKLREAGLPDPVETVWGTGYVWRPV